MRTPPTVTLSDNEVTMENPALLTPKPQSSDPEEDGPEPEAPGTSTSFEPVVLLL